MRQIQKTAITRTLGAALMLVSAVIMCGCNVSERVYKDIPTVTRGFTPHMQQVLNNVAIFTRDPSAWPSHVLVYKGSFEMRNQWVGSVGTSTKLENTSYATTRWELANLEDPYDIKRVRLLYQWQVGFIDFDALEKQWNEIRDRPLLDGSGKPILGKDGRPTFMSLPLPIKRDMKRDWTTQNALESFGKLGGSSSGLPVDSTSIWVTDEEAAYQFSWAVLEAMANSRVKARWSDAVMMTP